MADNYKQNNNEISLLDRKTILIYIIILVKSDKLYIIRTGKAHKWQKIGYSFEFVKLSN